MEMDKGGNMHQIRIYTINRGKMDEFVQVWRQGIAPIRQKIGFEIVGAWVNKDTNQFIWLISYSGEEEWVVKDGEYFNSSDRKKLNPDPASLIARSEQYFVDPVDIDQGM
jgi:hypothetical protein